MEGDFTFLSAPGQLSEAQLLERTGNPGGDYFSQDTMLLHAAGRTLAVSKRWGQQVMDAISSILDILPAANVSVELSSPTSEPEVVTYDRFEIMQDESTTITATRDGVPCSPTISILWDLAAKLGIEVTNGACRDMNSRQLGPKIIEAVGAQAVLA